MARYIPDEIEAYAERYTSARADVFDRLAAETETTQENHQMMVGERGDLREVRDDEDLVAGAQRLQTQADLDRRLAADAGIDLVEHEGRGRGRPGGRLDQGA